MKEIQTESSERNNESYGVIRTFDAFDKLQAEIICEKN